MLCEGKGLYLLLYFSKFCSNVGKRLIFDINST